MDPTVTKIKKSEGHGEEYKSGWKIDKEASKGKYGQVYHGTYGENAMKQVTKRFNPMTTPEQYKKLREQMPTDLMKAVFDVSMCINFAKLITTYHPLEGQKFVCKHIDLNGKPEEVRKQLAVELEGMTMTWEWNDRY